MPAARLYPAGRELILRVERFSTNPIITPQLDDRIGTNINGPSLVRVPDWLPEPLGAYYLYFAHHKGKYIRMAYADDLEGPWTTYGPGVLDLQDSFFANSHQSHHVASPDVHVDGDRRQIRMYYHGVAQEGGQRSRVAVSGDGVHFEAREEVLGNSYFRVFRYDGYHYAVGMPGQFYRSRDGLTAFDEGPVLFSERMRHSALRLDGDTLRVFYSNCGDCPERILTAKIDLAPDWMEWRESESVVVLEPERDYEGAALPLEPSLRGLTEVSVRQLRDPAIYEEDGSVYLLYSVAGEDAIAIAKLSDI